MHVSRATGEAVISSSNFSRIRNRCRWHDAGSAAPPGAPPNARLPPVCASPRRSTPEWSAVIVAWYLIPARRSGASGSALWDARACSSTPKRNGIVFPSPLTCRLSPDVGLGAAAPGCVCIVR
jgi:hypothetical protein